jgi:hypothetical protein
MSMDQMTTEANMAAEFARLRERVDAIEAQERARDRRMYPFALIGKWASVAFLLASMGFLGFDLALDLTATTPRAHAFDQISGLFGMFGFVLMLMFQAIAAAKFRP